MKSRKILIIGGNGFIGTNIARLLSGRKDLEVYSFDLVLPRLLAEVPVTAEWLAGLGNGGLCLNCDNCHFPNCGFGKGVR